MPDLNARVRARITARYAAEIRRRGGETVISGESRDVRLTIADRHDGMVLLHAEGWRQYQWGHRAGPGGT